MNKRSLLVLAFLVLSFTTMFAQEIDEQFPTEYNKDYILLVKLDPGRSTYTRTINKPTIGASGSAGSTTVTSSPPSVESDLKKHFKGAYLMITPKFTKHDDERSTGVDSMQINYPPKKYRFILLETMLLGSRGSVRYTYYLYDRLENKSYRPTKALLKNPIKIIAEELNKKMGL